MKHMFENTAARSSIRSSSEFLKSAAAQINSELSNDNPNWNIVDSYISYAQEALDHIELARKFIEENDKNSSVKPAKKS